MLPVNKESPEYSQENPGGVQGRKMPSAIRGAGCDDGANLPVTNVAGISHILLRMPKIEAFRIGTVAYLVQLSPPHRIQRL